MAVNDNSQYETRVPRLLTEAREMYKNAFRAYRLAIAEGDAVMAKNAQEWMMTGQSIMFDQRLIIKRPQTPAGWTDHGWFALLRKPGPKTSTWQRNAISGLSRTIRKAGGAPISLAPMTAAKATHWRALREAALLVGAWMERKERSDREATCEHSPDAAQALGSSSSWRKPYLSEECSRSFSETRLRVRKQQT